MEYFNLQCINTLNDKNILTSKKNIKSNFEQFLSKSYKTFVWKVYTLNIFKYTVKN